MRLYIVWGSSGAGKTAITLSVAAQLAERCHQEVLVLCNDSRTPALPVYLPSSTLTGANSLGGALETNLITEATLKGRIHRHPKCDRLYFMGHTSGEVAAISYPPPTRDAVAGLLQQLRQSPFQHILVDGDACPVYEPLTMYALEHAQAVVRVVTPDVKGYEWQKAQLAWLGNSDAFRAAEHIRVANFADYTTPVKAAQSVFGGFEFILPRASQVGERMAAGELLCGFSTPEAVRYGQQIAALTQRLMGETEVHGD